MNPAEILAARIREKRGRQIAAMQEKPRSYPSNRASELGHPCLRYLVLSRTCGEDAAPIDPTLLQIFGEGRLHEADIKRTLDDMGIHVYGSESAFPPNGYNITGHVDALYGFFPPEEPATLMVHTGIEIKSLNPHDWNRISEDDALTLLEPNVTRKWYSQAQTYMLLADLDSWLFIIKNKLTGEWKIIPVAQDLDFTQGCIDKAEATNKHVEDETIPDFLGDPIVCRRCKYFGRACQPPEDYAQGLMVWTNEEAGEAAAAVFKTQAVATANTRARNHLREVMRLLCNGEDRQVVMGDFIVSAKHTKRGMLVSVDELAPQEEQD